MNEPIFDGRVQAYFCPWPGCEYGHTEAGAVRLHYYGAHVRPQAKLRAKARETYLCPKCNAGLRALIDADPREREAKECPQKYTLLCPQCEEVY